MDVGAAHASVEADTFLAETNINVKTEAGRRTKKANRKQIRHLDRTTSDNMPSGIRTTA